MDIATRCKHDPSGLVLFWLRAVPLEQNQDMSWCLGTLLWLTTQKRRVHLCTCASARSAQDYNASMQPFLPSLPQPGTIMINAQGTTLGAASKTQPEGKKRPIGPAQTAQKQEGIEKRCIGTILQHKINLFTFTEDKDHLKHKNRLESCLGNTTWSHHWGRWLARKDLTQFNWTGPEAKVTLLFWLPPSAPSAFSHGTAGGSAGAWGWDHKLGVGGGWILSLPLVPWNPGPALSCLSSSNFGHWSKKERGPLKQ